MAGISRSRVQAVKRVQTNNIALNSGETTKNFTLPFPVTSGKAVVHNNGAQTDTAADNQPGANKAKLSHSSTAVTATRTDGSGSITIEFDVVEYY